MPTLGGARNEVIKFNNRDGTTILSTTRPSGDVSAPDAASWKFAVARPAGLKRNLSKIVESS